MGPISVVVFVLMLVLVAETWKQRQELARKKNDNEFWDEAMHSFKMYFGIFADCFLESWSVEYLNIGSRVVPYGNNNMYSSARFSTIIAHIGRQLPLW